MISLCYISGCSFTDPLVVASVSSSLVLESSNQLSSTISLTRLLYSRRSRSYNCEASPLAGDAGFGSLSKDCIEVSIADIS